MKKFGISFLLTAALCGFGLNSCDKDEFTEEDAMNLQSKLDKQKTHESDSLDIRNYRVSYTVNLVDASTSTLKSGSMLSAITGAKVKFIQDTSIIIKSADGSGVVAFSNLKPGLANVNIQLEGYSEVNYTVNLSSSSFSGGRQISNIIPLIPVTGTATGTIKGKVVYESDLTNNAPEPAPVGTKVLAMVSPNSAALPTTGLNGIVSISYDKLSLTATTDENGEFSMTVPATVNGLDYEILVTDFSVNQKLLQNTFNSRDTIGVLSIPTSFGTSFQNASSVSTGNQVIVSIGAPDYNSTPAVATAVIDNPEGIDYINITSNGGLYAPRSGYTIPLNDASIINASTSVATATFDVNSYGRVSKISVTSNGSKYLAGAQGFALSIPYCQTEAVVTMTVTSGVITGYTITNAGRYYVNRPEDVVFSYNGNSGSGATFVPSFTYSNGAYTLSSVNITNGGSGYPNSPTVITFNVKANGNLNQQATGKLHMTTGSVSAIKVTEVGSNYFSGQVDVIIGNPNILGSTKATATATVSNGKITAINITEAGSGYTSAPEVKIVNKAERIQARYTATVSNGQVTGFTEINQGNGYLTVPNVTITSAIPNVGSGASAYAVVSGGKVTSLVLVNKGSGYRGNIPGSSRNYAGAGSITVKGSSTSIVNIDLGTGKRSVEF